VLLSELKIQRELNLARAHSFDGSAISRDRRQA
jgi:hypothetical protein